MPPPTAYARVQQSARNESMRLSLPQLGVEAPCSFPLYLAAVPSLAALNHTHRSARAGRRLGFPLLADDQRLARLFRTAVSP